jgi:hypothetical protein
MSFARTLAVLILLSIVGVIGYQIGIGQNIAAQIPAAGAPVAYYGYPYHFAFGFLGFLFPLFFLFIIFGLLRAAMWGGRGWGGHHKYGYGQMRGPWGDEARTRIEELHKELHGEKPASSGPSSTST